MPKKKDNAEEEDRVFSKATVAAVLGGQGGPYFSAGKLERWSSPRSGHGMLWQEWGLVVLPPTIAAHHAQLKMLWTRSGNLVNVAWDKKRENERKGEGRKKKKKGIALLSPWWCPLQAVLAVQLRLRWSGGAARPDSKYCGDSKHNLGSVEGALRVTRRRDV